MTVNEVLSLFASCTGAGVIFGSLVFTITMFISWGLWKLRNS